MISIVPLPTCDGDHDWYDDFLATIAKSLKLGNVYIPCDSATGAIAIAQEIDRLNRWRVKVRVGSTIYIIVQK